MQYLNIDNELFFWITGGVFAVCAFIQLFYYIFFYIRILFYRKKSKNIEQPPVSVVICARNEAENLKEFLPLVLTQDYPVYEVVVVNDCSSDDSEDILSNLKKQYPRLKTTTILQDEKFHHGKKLALSIGIKAAAHEKILLTDADCRPVSKQWISLMMENFSGNVQIVLGYGGYFEEKGLLNKLIRYDTLFIAIQYFSYALAKIPYMGVGRNLSYIKSLFFNVKGFASHAHINSGDDDLFVNETANRRNTRIEIHPDSHIRSTPHKTFNSWRYQKRRHLQSGRLYKKIHKFLLGGEVISRCIFYISFIFVLLTGQYIEYVAGIFVFRMLLQLVIIKLAMNRLSEKDLLLSSLLFDIILPYISFSLVVSSYIHEKRNK